MSTKDISRFLLQPRKHYSGVRMQQGRVILDSDWNESERIDDEEARRTLVDMICSKGTSNQGFRVGNLRNAEVKPTAADPVASYDFDVANGSFYVGGLRFETETDEGFETFLGQSDWLQIDAVAENLPVRPADLPAGGVRRDLVYLRGWEQCVTAVEDSELRERALGGPDTSVRVRRMRRVEVLTDVPDGCAAAFSALTQRLSAPVAPDNGPSHTFDPLNSELKSKARITVVANPADITEDPCKPAVPGGYLGADNQTIRVQLTATDRFIWGYDNAAPLYRVQVENIPEVPAGVDGTRRKIRFLNQPRDQAAQPLAGQAVEIIPWGALLPNQEKVAEFQGALFTVETSFDPEDNSITITQPVSEETVKWLSDHPQFWSNHDEPERQQYLYLRLWTGGSGDAATPDHSFAPATPVPLAGTGLSVRFSDQGLVGDFWIIAARPNTPDLVVPWELLESAAPAGPRYFFAPLALIFWSLDQNNTLQTDIHDCRERFRPLCDIRGCCTVTVGDGLTSHGDFDSVEEAIAHLPAAGGEVCLLAGQHQAAVTLINRRNITIKGCGKQTRVLPRTSNREGAIFQVVDCQGVTLRDMEMVTLGGTAVVLQGNKPETLKEIDISHNRILAFKQAIQVRQGTGIQIHDNRLRMLDKRDAGVAIQILAEDSLIERNDIGVVPAERTLPPGEPGDTPDPTDPCADTQIFFINPGLLSSVLTHIFGVIVDFFPVAPFRALGGIQIIAASERIKVLQNNILGGAGNGITLGGGLPAQTVPTDEPDNQPRHFIDSAGLTILGDVLEGGVGVEGIGLVFTRADGLARTTVSRFGGLYDVQTEAGHYGVSLSSPGLEIKSIVATDDVDGIRHHRITIGKPQQPEPEVGLAFLYEIQIDRNEISRMGLSGIGFPIVAPRRPGINSGLTVGVQNPASAVLLALLGNPVVGLGIEGNHIRDCLQNPFDGELRAEARRRGFGGISLGFCEDVTISGNRIEGNGTSHINPACGLFIRFAEKVDIHDNHIFNNGPLAPNAVQDIEPGIRGGIVLLASSVGIEGVLVPGRGAFDTGLHAARIHDNIVHQPVGHALRLLGLGPTSMCDNRLISDRSGPEIVERLAGVVLMITLGGIQRLPAGPTLFNSNQVHLGEDANCLTAQLILTTDDIGFDGNQCVALTDGLILSDAVSLFTNTFLLGRTLRATDSRFKEPPGSRKQAFKLSLLTRTSLLNNTNDNQGDHCILAFNTATNPVRPPNIAGNQIVDAALCPRLNTSIAAPVSLFPVSAMVRDN
jgi:hypothetical protein